jgi:penicillin-binding protein A
MNAQITKLAVATLVLLVSLIVGTTYWQTWATASLADRQDNSIQRVAQFTIKRGKILAADGTVLAANRAKKIAGKTLYERRYPQGGLFANLVGYSSESRSRTGLERSLNDYLTASNSNLNTVLSTAFDRLKGATIKGNDVHLTVNPAAQRVALQQLAGRCGAVVALEPSTGKVLALASSPTFNPNLIDKRGGFASIQRIHAPNCSPAAPLVNRATDGLFVPGSTFKVVTTAAALASGKYTPNSQFYDPGYCTEYGVKVRNAGNPEAPEAFGNTDLSNALAHSINSVYCTIGMKIGAGAILDQAKKFGFYQVPPLETPSNERQASGLYKSGRLFDPQNPAAQVDPGRLAFGQERMQVTPLQMAMVAAAIGNGGVVMRPYAVDRISSPGGGTVTRTKPHALGRAVSPQIAGEINDMMQRAVTSGTATTAQIPGVAVAGKTGTAETGVDNIYTSWFITFAPADHPKVAVATVVENQPNGFGATVAAPIAKAVTEAILNGKSK